MLLVVIKNVIVKHSSHHVKLFLKRYPFTIFLSKHPGQVSYL